MLKKIFWWLGIITLIVFGGFFLWRLGSYLSDDDPDKTFLLPRLEFSVIEVTDLDADEIEMKANLVMVNQLPFSLGANNLHYQLLIDSAEIVKSKYEKKIELEGNDTSLVSLPIIFNREALENTIQKNEREGIDSVDYHLKIRFATNLFFGKEVTFHIHKKLPLIHLPKLKTDQIEVDSLNFSRAVILLQAQILNSNKYAFEARDISFRFAVENHDWLESSIPGKIKIAAEDSTKIEIPIHISLKEVGKTLFELLTMGKQVEYDLRMHFKIISENNMIDNSTAILKSSGSVRSLLKAAKSLKE